MIRRINLYGAPGAGKSTMSSFLFYNLKKMSYNIELVSEYIKMWTYIPRKPISWDSYYCQAKQLIKEDIILRKNVEFIISDSPILLANYYAKKENSPGISGMENTAKEFEELYPSINILIKRSKEKKYNSIGRYQNEEESEKIGKELEYFLAERIKYVTFYSNESEKVLQYTLEKIDMTSTT